MDLQILLFNNEIYGLTKGQYSPTSRRGTVSPSTPHGSFETPMSPGSLALGAGARFLARSVDTMQKHLVDVLTRAHGHRGTSFVEIFQNCLVFNDGVFSEFTERTVAAETQIHVEHGQRLTFGSERNRGLRLKPGALELEVVTIGEDGVTEDDLLVHDETNRALASVLVGLCPPAFPQALGVIYCNPAPTYEDNVREQITVAETAQPHGDLNALIRTGKTWEVAG